MTRRRLIPLALIIVGVAVGATVALTHRGSGAHRRVVTVYSTRSRQVMEPVIDAFRRSRGVEVSFVEGQVAALEQRLVGEKGRPRADVYVSSDTSTYERIAHEGIFLTYVSPGEAKLAGIYRSPDAYGRGVVGRAWVIIYNTALVKAVDAPRSVLALTDARWKGRVALAGYQERATLYWSQALVSLHGQQRSRAYVAGLVANGVRIFDTDDEVRGAVALGGSSIGLTTSAAAYQAIARGAPLGVVYPDQGDQGMGTLVIPDIVATVAGPDPQGARQFVDFLLTPDAQRLLARDTFELPLLPGVDVGAVRGTPIRRLGDFKAAPVGYDALAELTDEAMNLFAPTFGSAPGIEKEQPAGTEREQPTGTTATEQPGGGGEKEEPGKK